MLLNYVIIKLFLYILNNEFSWRITYGNLSLISFYTDSPLNYYNRRMRVVRRELRELREIRFILLVDLSVRLRARAKLRYLTRHRNGEYVRVITVLRAD